MIRWTPEELEEMRRADEEIEAEFRETDEEIVESSRRDRKVNSSGKKGTPSPKKRARDAERQRRRYSENPEKYKKMWHENYIKNREYYCAWQREYNKAHREAHNAWAREYYAANRERCKAYAKKVPCRTPRTVPRISGEIPREEKGGKAA